MEATAQVKVKKTDRILKPVIRRLPSWLTPNHLSILRACLVLPILLLMFLKFYQIAGALFLFAVLLDWFDGAMARIRGQTSKLGAILDPTADKIVNAAVFLGFLFWIKSNIYLGLVLSIILIDSTLFGVAIFKFIIKDIFPILNKQQDVFDHEIFTNIRVSQTGANAYGKIKMVVQSITISCMLLFNPARSVALREILPQIPASLTLLEISYFLLIACVGLGIFSLIGHLKVIEPKKSL